MTDSESHGTSEGTSEGSTTLGEGNHNDEYWRLRVEDIKVTNIPVIALDKVDERCVSNYTFGSIIAHGSQAVIFEACVSDKCDHVMRVVSFDLDEDDELKDQFFRDFSVRRTLMTSPNSRWYLPVTDAFVCRGVNGTLGVSISPRFDGNLLELVLKRFEDRLEMIEFVIGVNGVLSNIVSDLHANRIIHRDISALNFLFRQVDDPDSPDGIQTSLVLTDFETAVIPKNDRELDSGKFMDNRSLADLQSDLTNLATLLDKPRKIKLWKKITTYTRKWLKDHDSERWEDFE